MSVVKSHCNFLPIFFLKIRNISCLFVLKICRRKISVVVSQEWVARENVKSWNAFFMINRILAAFQVLRLSCWCLRSYFLENDPIEYLVYRNVFQNLNFFQGHWQIESFESARNYPSRNTHLRFSQVQSVVVYKMSCISHHQSPLKRFWSLHAHKHNTLLSLTFAFFRFIPDLNSNPKLPFIHNAHWSHLEHLFHLYFC